jgi:hypothetical protein
MSSTPATAGAGTDQRASPRMPSESLSQLVARILDQLSVSAWLPAVALVGGLTSLVVLHQEDYAVRDATRAVANAGWLGLVAIIGAVIVATMVTQAFQFESIRLLEGYWDSSRVGSWLSNTLSQTHIRRRNGLEAEGSTLRLNAYAVARQRMLDGGIPSQIVDAVERNFHGYPSEPSTPDDVRQRALLIDWRSFGPVNDVRRLAAIDVQRARIPRRDFRVLPMTLGNVLRSYEEISHDPASGSLEGMVRRQLHLLPDHLRVELQQFKARLELYCSMIYVLLLLGASGVALSNWAQPWWATAFATVTALLVHLSYRAAIASAEGYGSCLVEIGLVLNSAP